MPHAFEYWLLASFIAGGLVLIGILLHVFLDGGKRKLNDQHWKTGIVGAALGCIVCFLVAIIVSFFELSF